MKSLAIDTETTGLDPYHGCSAWVITTYSDEGNVWWETDVNPLNRTCQFTKSELSEVKDHLLGHNPWYFQNPVFDITFLVKAGCNWITNYWNRVRDVGIASHLLGSGNLPRNLESIVLRELGVDVSSYETKLKKEVQRAQGYARRKLPDWRVVSSSVKDPMLPSGGGWKADCWLLRKLSELLEHEKEHPWWTLAEDYYNADSVVTLKAGEQLEEKIRTRSLEKIYHKRLELIPVNYAMQAKGISLSEKRTYELKDKYLKESEVLEKKCVRLAKTVRYKLEMPKSGNNKSLLDTVFKGFKLEPIELSDKTGEPSLKKSVIEVYLEDLPEKSKARQFLFNLSEKRSRDTASKTYLTGYIRAWISLCTDENGEGWYVLHPSLNPTGTNTLRWSSSNPNEQNISKKENFNLRYCFGPAPGREWWSLDANNIELRIPGYESGEPELIDLFEKPDEPPYYGSEHLLNFSTVYPDIWEKELQSLEDPDQVGLSCKKKFASTWYARCKAGGFAVGYGSIDIKGKEWGTADTAFKRKGSHAKLKSRFANKEDLNRKWIRHANKHGYVETIPDEHVDPERGYPLECNRSERGFVKPTIPLNYHVQGTAMWWMGMAMIRCYKYLEGINKKRYHKNTLKLINLHNSGKYLNDGFFLIMQVHDELVFDFPKGKGKEPWKTNLSVIKKIRKLMELGGKGIGVPTPVSLEYHPNHWSEGQSIEV